MLSSLAISQVRAAPAWWMKEMVKSGAYTFVLVVQFLENSHFTACMAGDGLTNSLQGLTALQVH